MANVLVGRRHLNSLLDTLRFKIDVFPVMDYQPLPWLQIKKARRESGVYSRWHAIETQLNKLTINSAIDIGANVGYFSISLADRGANVISIESEPKYFRIMQYAVKKLNYENKIGLLQYKVTPTTVHILPCVDCVIFLAVWHHIVHEHGPEIGINMLQQIWAKTNKILFFETGETEMPAEYNLPEMKPNAEIFLHNFLQSVCTNSEIIHLGHHDAFAPDGKYAPRNLFGVVRK